MSTELCVASSQTPDAVFSIDIPQLAHFLRNSGSQEKGAVLDVKPFDGMTVSLPWMYLHPILMD